jgi:hypothetical protein
MSKQYDSLVKLFVLIKKKSRLSNNKERLLREIKFDDLSIIS